LCFTANLPSLGPRFCRKLTFKVDQKYRGRSGCGTQQFNGVRLGGVEG
jgi:hypothetical protein